jgi:hypothetical protein
MQTNEQKRQFQTARKRIVYAVQEVQAARRFYDACLDPNYNGMQNPATDLSDLCRSLDAVIETAASLREQVNHEEGYRRKPGTLLRRIRRVLGYAHP